MPLKRVTNNPNLAATLLIGRAEAVCILVVCYGCICRFSGPGLQRPIETSNANTNYLLQEIPAGNSRPHKVRRQSCHRQG